MIQRLSSGFGVCCDTDHCIAFIATLVMDCSRLEFFLSLSVVFPSFMIVVVGQGGDRACVKTHKETACVIILSALLEIFCNVLA